MIPPHPFELPLGKEELNAVCTAFQRNPKVIDGHKMLKSLRHAGRFHVGKLSRQDHAAMQISLDVPPNSYRIPDKSLLANSASPGN